MATNTTQYNFQKPEVGADTDAWGDMLNGNWDKTENILTGVTPILKITAAAASANDVVATFSGKVGIGTTTPSAVLDVVGTKIQLTGANPEIVLNDSTNPNICSIKNHDGSLDYKADHNNEQGLSRHRFYTDGTQRMEIESNGNVGIGTTSPSSKLHVQDSLGSPQIRIDNQGTGSGIASLMFHGGGTGNPTSIIQSGGTDSGNVGIIFKHGNNGSETERMRIDSTGNVGIGTTSPAYALDISQTSNASPVGLRIQNSEGSFILRTNGNQALMDAGSDVIFRNSSETERMRINSSGNLLVGKQAVEMAAVGVEVKPAGEVRITSDDVFGLQLNRKTGDGEIINLRKDGASVGSIGTVSGDIRIGGSDNNHAGIRFAASTKSVIPVKNTDGDLSDNNTDLGASNSRFKDLYISGSVLSNTSLNVDNPNGYAAVELGGPSGAYIDLKNPATDDYDARIITSGTDLELITANGDIILDASSNVGIGTSSPSAKLHIDSGATDEVLRLEGTGSPYLSFYDTGVRQSYIGSFGNTLQIHGDTPDTNIALYTANTERMRIDASGNVLIGTTDDVTSTNAGIQLRADNTMRIAKTDGAAQSLYRLNSNGDIINFYKDGSSIGSIGARASTAVYIDSKGTTGTAGLDIDVAIAPRKDGALSDGQIDLGTSAYRFQDIYLSGTVITDGVTTSAYAWSSQSNSTSSSVHLYFRNPNGFVGNISTSGTSTSYNTSSDYRLKENVVELTGATERLKQLNPLRFNFIADVDTTVDGFLAHEVADVVPEAISGEKDAMKDEEYEVTPAVLDDEGNVITEAVMGTRSVPDYQGIDQSKLVPLLVATIQELEARITQLENN